MDSFPGLVFTVVDPLTGFAYFDEELFCMRGGVDPTRTKVRRVGRLLLLEVLAAGRGREGFVFLGDVCSFDLLWDFRASPLNSMLVSDPLPSPSCALSSSKTNSNVAFLFPGDELSTLSGISKESSELFPPPPLSDVSEKRMGKGRSVGALTVRPKVRSEGLLTTL